MPSVSEIKPILKLTQKQWKALLERVVMREGKPSAISETALDRPMGFDRSRMMQVQPDPYGEIFDIPTPVRDPSVVDQVFQNVQPPSERVMGRLYTGQGPDRLPQDFPYPEAVMRYRGDLRAQEASSPEAIGYTLGEVPPAYNRLRGVMPGAPQDITAPEDMARGLAYERVKYRPIIPPSERRAQKVIEGAIREKEVQTIPASEILDSAQVLDQMWKQMGGKRSISGQLWERLRQSSNLRSKVTDSRDYFIRIGLRFKENPEALKKVAPREAKLMQDLWNEFEGQL